MILEVSARFTPAARRARWTAGPILRGDERIAAALDPVETLGMKPRRQHEDGNLWHRESIILNRAADRTTWEQLGSQSRPSWYLHPLAARQKRNVHLELIRRWAGDLAPQRVLKTDLFEEAFGEDQILAGLFPLARLVCAADEAEATVRAAALRFPDLSPGLVVMDVRRPAFREGSFDLIISTSTLDHFATRNEFVESLQALARLLRPLGRLILTLDNPRNPFLRPLRWYTRRRNAPFPLGYTPAMSTLREDLRNASLTVEDQDWIIHNPRGLSTLAFLVLERWFGSKADRAISALLKAFSLLNRLPTRRFTACFQAVRASKV
jgi:SAM-dependent methyltransferase